MDRREEIALESLITLNRLYSAAHEQTELLRAILYALKPSRVTGGTFEEISIMATTSTFVLIAPGNTPKFKITPTFSGAPFDTVIANAAIQSSDPKNFPVELDPTDPTGLTFSAAIPLTADPGPTGEVITITWTYTNADGTQAVVSGSVTELPPPVDDVIGGSFTQVQ